MSKELVILFSYQERLGRVDQDNKIPVAIRLGETPVPIPNTMVKTQEADGTMLETAWESRWLPDQKRFYQRSEYKIEKVNSVFE